MDNRFFICEHCGNIVGLIKSSGVPIKCCGQNMTELIPGTTDAAVEKHVPEVTVEGNKVVAFVGSVEHPMVAEHFIQFVALETEKGSQIKYLNPEEKPEAVFYVAEGDKAVAVYEYCNLHGLWKKEL